MLWSWTYSALSRRCSPHAIARRQNVKALPVWKIGQTPLIRVAAAVEALWIPLRVRAAGTAVVAALAEVLLELVMVMLGMIGRMHSAAGVVSQLSPRE
jgi:hypothetical protein